MADEAGKYPMKAVARLTGLNPDTIRAWERRYGAIAPARTEGDHRLYREADVERLRLLRLATEAGHGIGRVARLADDELRALASPVPPPAPGAPPADVVARILEAVAAYDPAAADRELARAAALLPPRRLVIEVAAPLMREVGDRWCDGRLTVAQEHVVSGLLRSVLGTLLRLADPPAGPPPLLFGTLPGERHELGAMMVALLAAARGVPVVYLGPDTPADEIAAIARATRAAVVGISMIMAPDAAAAGLALQDLARRLAEHGPGPALWLGGAGAERLPASVIPPGVRRLLSLEAAEGAIDAHVLRAGRPS